jgi:phage FluMu gp28-like protein
MTSEILTPESLLLEYQRNWVNDTSRFKLGIWSRQTGKDFSSADEGVKDCLQNPKTEWLIGAAGERQALESLGKWKEWAEAYKFAIEDYAEDRDSAQAVMNSASIVWQNGSRVIAVPANPNTVRGYSANVLLTEFGFMEDPEAVWRAILPSITNPLRGGEKKVRIVSTANGKSGNGAKLYELWNKEPATGSAMRWSKHLITIYDAVRMGLPVNVDELREALDDPEGWSQEYECEFIDGSNVLLPYELIALAESADASTTIDPEFLNQRHRGVKLGIDFGRTTDPTICITGQRVGDTDVIREVLELRNMSTPDQLAILDPRIRIAERVCWDYTGPGIGGGDELVKRHGEWKPEEHKFGKIELCTFTVGFKREIFPKLRRRFEAPTRLRVPIDRTFREDLHAMQQIVQNGEYNYWAPRTKEGHSDRCTALALFNRAAAGAVPFAFSSVNKSGQRGRASRRSRQPLI